MKQFRVILFIGLVLFMSTMMAFIKSPLPEGSGNSGFAVVELFTSEGCSSCPPADEAVAALAKESKGNVYVLSFHVDYWNYLGWKDAFSSAAYSDRQKEYAGVLKLNSIYTPQVIVNGKTEFVGSDETRLRQSIQDELKSNATTGIAVNAKGNDQNVVIVSYKINKTDKGVLNIALVQLHGESAVKRGENEGKHLHHINIVRDFKTVTNNEGSMQLIIPKGLSSKECKVICFVQDRKDLRITDATEALIN